MYSELLQLLKTTEDVEILSSEIDLLLSKLYKAQTAEFDNALKNSIRQKISEVLTISFSKGYEKKNYLLGLKKQLERLKVLKLGVAFEPTYESIDIISLWVKSNIGEDAVIEFAYTPNMLAGVIIEYGGKYLDFSYNHFLDEAIVKNQTYIKEKLYKN